MKAITTLVLASALGLPTFFAGYVFAALPSCGACVVGAQPASHVFVTSTTNCFSSWPVVLPKKNCGELQN